MKFFLFLSLVAATFISCTTKNEAESQASDAYERGLEEGQRKGYEKGQEEGYSRGYDEGYDKGYDETLRPIIEEKHGYSEKTYPVPCQKCGGDGFIDGISQKEICPICKMAGVIQVTKKEYY